jgi:hypothetical protein
MILAICNSCSVHRGGEPQGSLPFFCSATERVGEMQSNVYLQQNDAEKLINNNQQTVSTIKKNTFAQKGQATRLPLYFISANQTITSEINIFAGETHPQQRISQCQKGMTLASCNSYLISFGESRSAFPFFACSTLAEACETHLNVYLQQNDAEKLINNNQQAVLSLTHFIIFKFRESRKAFPLFTFGNRAVLPLSTIIFPCYSF